MSISISVILSFFIIVLFTIITFLVELCLELFLKLLHALNELLHLLIRDAHSVIAFLLVIVRVFVFDLLFLLSIFGAFFGFKLALCTCKPVKNGLV